MRPFQRYSKVRNQGLSLIELVVVVTIVGILLAVSVNAVVASKNLDDIDRGAQTVMDDLIYIRSAAISTNQTYRVNFLSRSSWQLQYYDDESTSWVNTGPVKNMPSNVYLTQDAFDNALDNLESTPRGIFNFMDGATGSPFVTIEALGETKSKSVIVGVGGAVEKQAN